MSINQERKASLSALVPERGLRERPTNRNRKAHHADVRLYHGAIQLEEPILDSLSRSHVFRTTHRKLTLRIQRDGITYLLRIAPQGADYVGEVVRTPEGAYRVHCWTVASHAGRPIAEILERDRERSAEVVPPMPWPVETESQPVLAPEYSMYFEPPWLTEARAE